MERNKHKKNNNDSNRQKPTETYRNKQNWAGGEQKMTFEKNACNGSTLRHRHHNV